MYRTENRLLLRVHISLKAAQYQKAVEEFKLAIEPEPEYPDVYLFVGKIYLKLKDESKATLYLEKYTNLGGSEDRLKKILKIRHWN